MNININSSNGISISTASDNNTITVLFEYANLKERCDFLTMYQSIIQKQALGTGLHSGTLPLPKIGFNRLVLQNL